MKQIRFSLAICAVATLAVFVADAQAQRGSMGGMMMNIMLGGGGGRLHSELLVMEQVQAEIKLTDEQQEKIVPKAKELFNAFQSEKREIMQDGGDAAKVGELLKAKQDEEKEIVASLNDDQKKRLRQLLVQRMGNGAFQNAKIAKELGISDEQKKEIKKAVVTVAETMQKAMEEARESRDFDSIRTASTDMQKKLTESLMGVMNDKQKSKYKEMRGEKFEFPQR